MRTLRLIVGIITIIFVFVIMLQPCSAGVGAELSGSEETSDFTVMTQTAVADLDAIYTQVAATIIAEANTPITSEPTKDPVATSDSSDEINVEKSLLDIEITLPSSFFLDTDMAEFDTVAYVEENGFKKAIVNDDGSLTITMSKSKHKELMEEYAEDLEKLFIEFIEAEDTPYISNITSDSDFNKVIIDVEKTSHESSFDLTPLSIGFDVMFYQSLSGIDVHCEVVIRDKDTGDILNSVIYPDAFQ